MMLSVGDEEEEAAALMVGVVEIAAALVARFFPFRPPGDCPFVCWIYDIVRTSAT
jgi:hypothetical protein